MKRTCLDFVILLAACVGLHFVGNGLLDLSNPDEVFYVGTAKEMMQQHTWTTPYLFGQPQFEKPILLYWLLRSAFAVTGSITPFAARFFPALFAGIGVLGIYTLAGLIFCDRRKAMMAALIMASSALYIGMARTVFTDMIFTVFILLALTAFIWGYVDRPKRMPAILLFFFFAAAATLTKGPLGLLIPLLIVFIFLAMERDHLFFCGTPFWVGLALFAVLAVPWYALMLHRYGNAFVTEFFYNDHWRRLTEAEHLSADHWYIYPSIMVGGMFPWSLYVLGGLIGLCARMCRRTAQRPDRLLVCWLFVVFVIFQVAHSKLASYIMPLFPALALLTAHFVCEFNPLKRVYTHVITWGTFALLLALSLVVALAKSRTGYLPLSPTGLLFTLAGALFLLAAVYLALSLSSRAAWATYALIPIVGVVLSGLTFTATDVNRVMSTNSVANKLIERLSHEDGAILCAKKHARAVRFYTGRDISIIAIGGRDYFSPHPVPLLTTRRAVIAMLKSSPLTYCVTDDESADILTNTAAGHYRCRSVWKDKGGATLLEVRPIVAPGSGS